MSKTSKSLELACMAIRIGVSYKQYSDAMNELRDRLSKRANKNCSVSQAKEVIGSMIKESESKK